MKTQQQIEQARQAIREKEAETRSQAINRYLLTAELKTAKITALQLDLTIAVSMLVLAVGIAVAAILGNI